MKNPSICYAINVSSEFRPYKRDSKTQKGEECYRSSSQLPDFSCSGCS
ncbi:protein of unknown function [Candidatus Nitrosocosmicus franklandus]|uniref:Uncharacterized protein n=1 Tax=Candidatus Nitrosocosmicus franklandianus TaxID=1798806 RepID=A0A484IEW7_9ARCH|nr:protein of unknown function [Candidatus Nitrosocosmicus franklandus]